MELNEAGATNVVVDLSGNRFSADSISRFSDICALPAVQYLVCPNVGLVDAVEQRKHAPPALFERFIFMRELYLPSKNWENIVPPAHYEKVEQAHANYYDSIGKGGI